MLPAVEGVTITPFDNPRVRRTQAIAEFIVGPEVQQAFAAGRVPNKDAFVEQFGAGVLANGENVRDALEIVPGEVRFGLAAGRAGRAGHAGGRRHPDVRTRARVDRGDIPAGGPRAHC